MDGGRVKRRHAQSYGPELESLDVSVASDIQTRVRWLHGEGDSCFQGSRPVKCVADVIVNDENDSGETA